MIGPVHVFFYLLLLSSQIDYLFTKYYYLDFIFDQVPEQLIPSS